jgi:hypothetical protein
MIALTTSRGIELFLLQAVALANTREMIALTTSRGIELFCCKQLREMIALTTSRFIIMNK